MSTEGSASGLRAAAISAGASVGRSPCTLTTISARPSGSMAASASKIRSEPETWPALVITARPPAFSTQAAIASESVATATGPMPAASARRMTCTIIGSPAISASGLPGSREEARRAGMRIKASRLAMGGHGSGKRAQGPNALEKSRRKSIVRLGLYGLPEERQTGYLCHAVVRRRDVRQLPVRLRSPNSMDSFEMNKILGAILGTALIVVALNIASGAIFAPEIPAKPGYNIVVPKAATG